MNPPETRAHPQPVSSRARLAQPARRARLAAVLLASVALLAACSESSPSSPPSDAGDELPSCELGTEQCACLPNGTCDEPLLCVTGRCVVSQGSREPEQPRPTRPEIPILGEPDAGSAPTPPAPEEDGGAPPDAATDGG